MSVNCSLKDEFKISFVLFITAVERIILEQLGELHLKVDHFTAVVQSLRPHCHERTDNHQPQSNNYDLLLPISTLEELNCFDEKLRRDGDFKKYVVCL